MPTQVKTLIIQEKEVLIVRPRPYIVRELCQACGIEVSMITPAHAAILTAREIEKIFFLMRTGEVHLFLHHNGKSLVCLNSLGSI